MHSLTGDELVALVQRVFSPGPDDRALAILVDLPDAQVPDDPIWRARREMAAAWHEALAPRAGELGLERVALFPYRNPRANNADLPPTAWAHPGGPLPADADAAGGEEVPFTRIFGEHSILMAPTQFSATAPLKMAAREHGFRAATMPGFTEAMIPALRLDYRQIGARVERLRELVTRATECRLRFRAAGEMHELLLDLRHRPGHASGGLFPKPGVAGNLPSGETYIVPYEGEIEGDPTCTAGRIPVQFDDGIVVYRVENNRAIEVLTDNPASVREKDHLRREPAYGNMAELGLGVLGDFGLEPTGQILLDEKLGLHVAFGRSEHFGGQVGPDSFSAPDKVVHIDRVYIPKIQPDITVAEALLTMEGGTSVTLMEEGRYMIDLEA